MSWNAIFDEGLACYQRGDFEGALIHMNQAAELEGNAFIIYDSRAAVHEKLGNLKAAILDSNRVIDLAPDKWQGHARLARLFDLQGKHGPVIKSIDHALSHLQLEDVQRHTQLLELKERAVAAQADVEKRRPPQVAHSYLLGKLPMETLLEILGVLIDEDHTWAIKLSHVCGHWRQILIDTPSAWQTLVLSRKCTVQKVRLWKQRAKNRISRISVDFSVLWDRHSVFAELQDLSWDDLWSLRIPCEAFLVFHRILSDLSIPHAFSNLGELIFVGWYPPNLLSNCFSGPMWRLRTLHLTGLDNEWGLHIPKLKELDLNLLRSPFSMSVFTHNPSLEKLSIKDSHYKNRDPDNASDVFPICMGNLRFVEFDIHPNPFDIARTITVPSITHFSMVNATVRADETLLHIASHPSLVQLSIKDSCLSPSTFMTLLSSTPNLETLQVSNVCGIANELLHFLATVTTGPVQGLPCHALKHVDVSRCIDLTTSSVYAFVKTRVQYASDPPGSAERCADIVSLNVEEYPKCPNLDIEADMLQWFRSKIVQFKWKHYIPPRGPGPAFCSTILPRRQSAQVRGNFATSTV